MDFIEGELDVVGTPRMDKEALIGDADERDSWVQVEPGCIVLDVGQEVVFDAANPQTKVPTWVVVVGGADALAGVYFEGLVGEDGLNHGSSLVGPPLVSGPPLEPPGRGCLVLGAAFGGGVCVVP